MPSKQIRERHGRRSSPQVAGITRVVNPVAYGNEKSRRSNLPFAISKVCFRAPNDGTTKANQPQGWDAKPRAPPGQPSHRKSSYLVPPGRHPRGTRVRAPFWIDARVEDRSSCPRWSPLTGAPAGSFNLTRVKDDTRRTNHEDQEHEHTTGLRASARRMPTRRRPARAPHRTRRPHLASRWPSRREACSPHAPRGERCARGCWGTIRETTEGRSYASS